MNQQKKTLSKLESLERLGVLTPKTQVDVKLPANQAQLNLHGTDMASEINISSLIIDEDSNSQSMCSDDKMSKNQRRKLRNKLMKKNKGGEDFILEEEKEV